MAATLSQLIGEIRPPTMTSFYSTGNGGGGDTGGGETGGGGFPDPNPITIGFLPVGDPGGFPPPGPITIGTTPTTTTTTSTTPTATSASFLPNFLQYFTSSGCGVGDFLLRIAFFILGIVAIIGAIYLYKGSNPVLSIPSHIAHGVVRAGRELGEVTAE